ncbi:hypothetical protein ACSBM8_03485 [Sphingomonas sp. ASY06-1R]|uniref:hypothetical protein n=1 Tax=Sphingomonas sp. ASY06-1R TaxID=3445771 RepID=UPI003FA33B42
MKFVTPAAKASFTIAADGTPPTIAFQTDAAGPHSWEWTITWKTFSKKGKVETPDNKLDGATFLQDLGGTLEVHATVPAAAGKPAEVATVKVTIIGTNPTVHDVTVYLATKADSAGFSAILQHESRGRNFNDAGEPIKSYDNGYGMCQLTTPKPTMEQVWSWKRNVDGGLKLFATKVTDARNYLSQSGRTFTDDQLQREAVCRWNGGAYHTWDGKAWVRNPDILCDSATGNNGWDMTKDENTGKTEAELHKRDKDEYKRGHKKGDLWKPSGVCYADAILG